jgi:membrane protein insertase Oxa1/YidC/SpoIIIJ
MLQRLWALNIPIRMQRKCFKNISNLDAPPRLGIWCQHSRLHSLTKKSDSSSNKSRIICYCTGRNSSYSYLCYSSLHHNRWTFTADGNINSLPSVARVRPHFQIRQISGQSGVETVGVWPRVFLWLSESTPVSYAQDLLLFLHNSAGLPWWTTIIVTTVFLRTVVTLPLAFYQVCSVKTYKD